MRKYKLTAIFLINIGLFIGKIITNIFIQTQTTLFQHFIFLSLLTIFQSYFYYRKNNKSFGPIPEGRFFEAYFFGSGVTILITVLYLILKSFL